MARWDPAAIFVPYPLVQLDTMEILKGQRIYGDLSPGAGAARASRHHSQWMGPRQALGDMM